jgi:CheY-like chemotaxis protein
LQRYAAPMPPQLCSVGPPVDHDACCAPMGLIDGLDIAANPHSVALALVYALSRVQGKHMTILSLAGRSILIIEDEALIAFDLARAFERAGANVTATSKLHHAHSLLQHNGFCAAVLDHALGDGDTQSICRFLKLRGVPFVTYSGFSGPDLGECSGVYVAKPQPPEVVVEVIADLLRSVAAPSAFE